MAENTDAMTRERAVQAIREGGSVIFNGKHYTSVSELPGEAEFVVGNPVHEDLAFQSIQAQIAALSQQAAILRAAQEARASSQQGAQAQESVNAHQPLPEMSGAKSSKEAVKAPQESSSKTGMKSSGSTSADTSDEKKK